MTISPSSNLRDFRSTVINEVSSLRFYSPRPGTLQPCPKCEGCWHPFPGRLYYKQRRRMPIYWPGEYAKHSPRCPRSLSRGQSTSNRLRQQRTGSQTSPRLLLPDSTKRGAECPAAKCDIKGVFAFPKKCLCSIRLIQTAHHSSVHQGFKLGSKRWSC